MALITAAQFREHYPALSGTTEDTVLLSLIARADDLMAAWCGYRPYDGLIHTLTAQSYTLDYSAPSQVDPRALCLCVHPVSAVASVKTDSTGFYTGSETTLVASTDYVLWTETGILVHSSRWPVGLRGIRVAFTGGYATTPPALVALGAMATRHLWDLRRTQGQGQYTVQGGGSATLVDAERVLPAFVKEGLLAYRCPGSPVPLSLQEAA